MFYSFICGKEYQLDLTPDERGTMQLHKSVIKWDSKKKKYLPVMVAADGRVVKPKSHKDESGATIKDDSQTSGSYQKWAKACGMIKGHFKKFKHQHIFQEENNCTQMTDILEYTVPYGIIGKIADQLFIKRHMSNFLKKRNYMLKKSLEA